MKITFPDGTDKEFSEGVNGLEIAQSISEGLARAAVAINVNGELKDLTAPIEKSADIQILTFKDEEGVDIFRHSTAHILAAAVIKLYPDAKPTIGPSVDEGFYYDFDMPPVKPEDLSKIEEEMKNIINEKLSFERQEMSKDEALVLFKDNPYKVQLLEEMEDETASVYTLGNFSDLCRGPHIINTGKVKAFKLTKIAGAYWKGDAKNKQLQRIYGISYSDKKELKQYLTLIEEASKRDHRKIGKEMDLFSFHEEAPGMPFFHSKGTFIWNTLHEFVKGMMLDRNYEINKTPIILNKSLWLQSGHWDHYQDNMYFTKIDKADYAVKPMNCHGNILIYKSKAHSYRDLPIRAGEFGLVHRHELSGVLSGLFRVRCFTQDDAHVFCTEEQIKDELKDLLDFTDKVYSTFGFEYHIELSTKPDDAMGDPKLWDSAEKKLKEVLDEAKKEYKINEGDGAFYGPKIDFHLKDAIGRNWQCGTIQLDFQMPEKFDLTYEGSDSKKHRPVMIHRAILGSVERFLGILVEHYAGKFPLWINPEQVRILPIADRHKKFAEEVQKELKDAGIRANIDERTITTSKKVREAELSHVNYILVVGDKEVENKTVNVRTRDNEVRGEIQIAEFASEMIEEINQKK